MYSGVRRASGPPGFNLRRLYSLQGGAPISRPIQPLQQSLSKASNTGSKRMSWLLWDMMSIG